MLLAAAALAWLVSEWNTPGAGAAFTPGLLLYAAWPALLAAAALRGLDERPLDRPSIVVLAASFGAGIGLLGLASAAVFDPDAQGCIQCPANLLLDRGRARPRALARPGGARGDRRLGRGLRGARNRTDHPRVAGPQALVGARAPSRRSPRWPCSPSDAIHGLDRGFLSNDPTDRALRLAEAGALALVAAGSPGPLAHPPDASGADTARPRHRRRAGARRAPRRGSRTRLATRRSSCCTAWKAASGSMPRVAGLP